LTSTAPLAKTEHLLCSLSKHLELFIMQSISLSWDRGLMRRVLSPSTMEKVLVDPTSLFRLKSYIYKTFNIGPRALMMTFLDLKDPEELTVRDEQVELPMVGELSIGKTWDLSKRIVRGAQRKG
jgi:hypothetical protein